MICMVNATFELFSADTAMKIALLLLLIALAKGKFYFGFFLFSNALLVLLSLKDVTPYCYINIFGFRQGYSQDKNMDVIFVTATVTVSVIAKTVKLIM